MFPDINMYDKNKYTLKLIYAQIKTKGFVKMQFSSIFLLSHPINQKLVVIF